ncbi:LCP family protein [Candidatus Gracilibacteria bacterium]|nr:LCP family protein [Candidatus Gracilibacteria bacterium]
MNFKVREISRSQKKIKNKWWRKWVRCFGPRLSVVLAIIISLAIIFGISSAVMGSDFHFAQKTRDLFSLGPLSQDSNNHTNILLLGVGGDGAEGGNLSDSIMIASFNPQNPSVAFLSLPRDLFIPSKIGERKLNEIYAAARYKYGDRRGLEIIKDAVSDFSGIRIHYGAVINFKVFEEVVEALGGLEIFVPTDIEDPFYPDEDYGYQTFVIRKGLQHLDGATALKYARSRKTSSDYDRAQRQQDLILALRKRAEDLSFLTDFGKLTEFFQIYRKHVNTDLGLTQIVALAKMGMAIDYYNAVSAVLNDDPTQRGGFLFTPAMEFYGGQYVLLPENLKDTQTFLDLVLIHPGILLENAQISVLNGSKLSGRASETAERLRRLGFHIIEVGNYDADTPVYKTFLKHFSPEKTLKTTNFLADFFETSQIENVVAESIDPNNLIDIQIILGTN